MLASPARIVLVIALVFTAPVRGAHAGDPAPDVEGLLVEAVTLQEAGNHGDAIVKYRGILEVAPGHPRALAGLAFSTYTLGDYEATVEVAERILATGKDCPSGVYLIVGSAYGMLGIWDKAEEVLLLGQSVWPEDEALRFHRAINLFAQGKLDVAIDELERCIRSSPYRPEYWKALGDALQSDGAPGRAFAAYVRAATLEENPERSRALAQQIWKLIRDGAEAPSAPRAGATEAAEAAGLSLVGILRNDERWKNRDDAAFFAYATDNVLRLVSALHARGERGLFWGPFVLAYFDDLRTAGHMESLAYDIRRAADDPDAKLWGRLHADQVSRYRDWSQRWAVDWSRVQGDDAEPR